MIGSLHGKISAKTTKYCLISVNGIGYEVLLNIETLNQLQVGNELTLYIHTKVSSDDINLFGFLKQTDKDFFRILLNISGVGPKLALNITDIPKIIINSAILTDDPALLAKIPGIGKKTAARIILELKDKDLGVITTNLTSNQNQIAPDVISALENLGYKQLDIIKFFHNQDTYQDLSEEEQVKLFLHQAAS